jgi:hypothetical protein
MDREGTIHLTEEINLENLIIKVRKSTPKNHRRAKIWVKKGSAKVEITDQEKWLNVEDMCCVLNHEFLHWIITNMTKTRPKQYDKYLESLGLYYHEILREIWQ